jgi:hypothetical protein
VNLCTHIRLGFLEYRVLLSDQRVERTSRGREFSSSDLRTAEEMRHAHAQAQPERALEIYERTGRDPMPDPTGPLFPQDLWLLAFLLKRKIQRQEWASTTTHRRQRRPRSSPG